MKLKYILAILVLALFNSCGESFLEEEPKTFLSADLAYSTIEGVESAVATIYGYPFRFTWGNPGTNLSCFLFAGTDVSRWGNSSNATNAAMHTYSGDLNEDEPNLKIFWDQSYKFIFYANTAIEAIEALNDADQGRKDVVMAEAKFWRAYIYNFLMDRFENVPLVNKVTDPTLTDVTPAEKSKVYELIVSDLQFAATNLPLNASEPGRLTKGAANHLMANVFLTLERWQDAANAAEAVINSGVYSLEEDFANLWDQTKDNANELNECIFVLQADRQTSHSQEDNKSTQFANLFTSAYSNLPGMEYDIYQGGRDIPTILPNDYVLSVWEDGDERHTASINYTWTYNYAQTLPDGVSLGDTVAEGLIDPCCRKWWDAATVTQTEVGNPNKFKDVIWYRLGETYLFAAEAYMQLDQDSKALSYINTLRRRAFNDTEHDLTSLDQPTLLDERTREMLYEGKRWSTLKRMGALVNRVREHNPQAEPYIQDYHVRMPIPQHQIDLSDNYPQNTGY